MQTFTALPPPKGICSSFLLLFLQTCFVFPSSAISINHSCLSFLFPPPFIFVLSSYRHQHFYFKKSVTLLLSPSSFYCFVLVFDCVPLHSSIHLLQSYCFFLPFHFQTFLFSVSPYSKIPYLLLMCPATFILLPVCKKGKGISQGQR